MLTAQASAVATQTALEAAQGAFATASAEDSEADAAVLTAQASAVATQTALEAAQGALTTATTEDAAADLVLANAERAASVDADQIDPVQRYLVVGGSDGLTLDEVIAQAQFTDLVVAPSGVIETSLSQAQDLVAKGASFHNADGVTLTATAADLLAATDLAILRAHGVDTINVSNTTVGELSVANTTKLLNLADNDSALSITLKDTAANLATHTSAMSLPEVKSVVVDGAANVADATAIHTAKASVAYTVADSATTFLSANEAQAGAIKAATVANVSPDSVPATLNVAQVTKLLDLATNDASLSITLKDTAANLSTHTETMNLTGVSSVVVDGAANVAQASAIHAAKASVSYTVTDTTANLLKATGADLAALESSKATVVTATELPATLTIDQATKLNGVADNYATLTTTVSDNAKAFVALSPESLAALDATDVVNAVKGTEALTVVEANKLQELKTNGVIDHVSYNVSDTVEHLFAATAGLDLTALAGFQSAAMATDAVADAAELDDLIANQTDAVALRAAATLARSDATAADTAALNAAEDDRIADLTNAPALRTEATRLTGLSTSAAKAAADAAADDAEAAKTDATALHNTADAAKADWEKAVADDAAAAATNATELHASADANLVAYNNAVEADRVAGLTNADSLKSVADAARSTYSAAAADTLNVSLPKMALVGGTASATGVKLGVVAEADARDFAFTLSGADSGSFEVKPVTVTAITGGAKTAGAVVELADGAYDANGNFTVKVFVNVPAGASPEDLQIGVNLGSSYPGETANVFSSAGNGLLTGWTYLPDYDSVTGNLTLAGYGIDAAVTGKVALGIITIPANNGAVNLTVTDAAIGGVTSSAAGLVLHAKQDQAQELWYTGTTVPNTHAPYAVTLVATDKAVNGKVYETALTVPVGTEADFANATTGSVSLVRQDLPTLSSAVTAAENAYNAAAAADEAAAATDATVLQKAYTDALKAATDADAADTLADETDAGALNTTYLNAKAAAEAADAADAKAAATDAGQLQAAANTAASNAQTALNAAVAAEQADAKALATNAAVLRETADNLAAAATQAETLASNAEAADAQAAKTNAVALRAAANEAQAIADAAETAATVVFNISGADNASFTEPTQAITVSQASTLLALADNHTSFNIRLADTTDNIVAGAADFAGVAGFASVTVDQPISLVDAAKLHSAQVPVAYEVADTAQAFLSASESEVSAINAATQANVNPTTVGELTVANTVTLLARADNDTSLSITLKDTAAHMAASTSTLNAAGVSAVVVDGVATVAHADTIFAAKATAVFDVSDTALNIVTANASAKNALKAAVNVNATAGGVDDVLTVDQASMLHTLTLPATQGVAPVVNTAAYNVKDTAAHLIAATGNALDALESVQAGTVTATEVPAELNVLSATKLLGLADNDADLTITLKDTAENLAAHTGAMSLQGVTGVVVQGDANVLEATAIHGAKPLVAYTVTDSVAAFLAADQDQSAAINAATSATVTAASVTAPLSVGQTAKLLSLADNDADLSVTINDTATNMLADTVTLGLTGVSSVVVQDTTLSAANLKLLDTASIANVVATAATSITGTLADVSSVLSAVTIDTATDVSVTVSDTEATADQLIALTQATTGVVHAHGVARIHGSDQQLLSMVENGKLDLPASIDLINDQLVAELNAAIAADNAAADAVAAAAATQTALDNATSAWSAAVADDTAAANAVTAAALAKTALNTATTAWTNAVSADETAAAAATDAAAKKLLLDSATTAWQNAVADDTAAANAVSAAATAQANLTAAQAALANAPANATAAQRTTLQNAVTTAQLAKTTADDLVTSKTATANQSDATALAALKDSAQAASTAADSLAASTKVTADATNATTLADAKASALATSEDADAWVTSTAATAALTDAAALATAKDAAFAADATADQLVVTTAATAALADASKIDPVQRYLVVGGSDGLTLDQVIAKAEATDLVVAPSGVIATSLEQARALVAKGASFHNVEGVTLTATSANLLAATDLAALRANGVDNVHVSNTTVGELNVANATKLLALADNDNALSITLKDSAANLASNTPAMSLAGVTSVVVDGAANVMDATAIHSAKASVAYTVTDTAAAFLASTPTQAGAINAATTANVTPDMLPASLTVAQTTKLLELADNDQALSITLKDTPSNLSAQTALLTQDGVTSVVVDGAATVAQAAAIHGANAAVSYDVTDTSANMLKATGSDLATLESVMAGTVTATDVPSSLTVAEATKLLALADNDADLHIKIVDSAANIAAALDAKLNVTGIDSVTANSLATAAQAATIAAFAKDVTYSVSDTATNIAAQTGGLHDAVAVTVTSAATVAEAAVIHTARADVLYSTADVAQSFLDANATQATAVDAATNADVTPATSVPGALTVAEATKLLALADNDSTLHINIVDSAANIAAALDAKLNVTGVDSVTVSGTATAAQAATIAGFTKDVTYSVSDTAANIAANTGGLADAVSVTATTNATVEQAVTIHDARATAIYALTDSADVFLAAGKSQSAAINAATTATATNVPAALTVDQATKLLALADNDSDLHINIVDSAANVAAALDAKLNVVGVDAVTVSGTATAAQATTIAGFDKAVTYSVNDTVANIVKDTSGLAEAVTVTATGDATVAQAVTIHTARGDASYSVTDSATVFVDATDTQVAAINAATAANATPSTVPATLTVDQAYKLLTLADNDASLKINIVDTAAQISAKTDAINLVGVNTVTVSDAFITVDQADAIHGARADVVYSVQDSAAAFIGAGASAASAVNAATTAIAVPESVPADLTVTDAAKLLNLADNDEEMAFNLTVSAGDHTLADAVNLAMTTSATVSAINAASGVYTGNGSMVINKAISITGDNIQLESTTANVFNVSPSVKSSVTISGINDVALDLSATTGTNQIDLSGFAFISGVNTLDPYELISKVTEITGGSGSDTINAKPWKDLTINASLGDDYVNGGSGTDRLNYASLGLSVHKDTAQNRSIVSGNAVSNESVTFRFGSDTATLTWTTTGLMAATLLAQASVANPATQAAASNKAALTKLTNAGATVSVDANGHLVVDWNAVSGWTADLVLSGDIVTGVDMEVTADPRAFTVDKLTGSITAHDVVINIDEVVGTAYNDVLRAASLDTILDGGDGNDTLYGGAGNDTIETGAGNDLVFAGEGNNTINVNGGGNDTINAGSGNDTINVRGAGNYTINAGGGNNIVNINFAGNVGTSVVNTGTGDDAIAITGGANNTIVDAGGDNTITIDSAAANNNVTTGAGADIVTVNGVDNVVDTGAGNDIVNVNGSGSSNVASGTGADTINIAGSGTTTVNAGAGNDTINTGNANVTVVGAAGNVDANTGAAADGKDTVVVGVGSHTSIQGMSLSTAAANLVGRNDATNDQIKFEFTDAQLNTLLGNHAFKSWDVKLEGQVLSGNTLSGDLVLYALADGVGPIEVSKVHLSWDNSAGLNLADYNVSLLTPVSTLTDATHDISTSLRLALKSEILDTTAQVGLLGGAGTDNVVLAAQVAGGAANAGGAQVVVAGLGSDNYITRVDGVTYNNGHVVQQVSAAYDVANWNDYQTILDMGSVTDKTQVDAVVIEGVRDLSDLQLERVQLVGEGENSLHIAYNQFAHNADGENEFFATGHLQIFGQLSEWSPQYHIEKLQIIEQSNALDITKAATTYFFGEQTKTFEDANHNVTGVQVQADASRDSLLIGSSGVDEFVVNGIDSTNDHDMWLYGADFQALDGTFDNLTLKFKDAALLNNVTDTDHTIKGNFTGDVVNGFVGANGLVHVDLSDKEMANGSKVKEATITMNNGTADTKDDVSLSIFFADGGNVDSTFLNKIKWES